jgi:hypothetical protein
MSNLKDMTDRQLVGLLQSLTDCDGVLEQTELAQEAQNELLTRPNCFRIRPDYFDTDFEKAIAFLCYENSEIVQSL